MKFIGIVTKIITWIITRMREHNQAAARRRSAQACAQFRAQAKSVDYEFARGATRTGHGAIKCQTCGQYMRRGTAHRH